MDVLDVFLHERRVGRLVRRGDGHVVFALLASYREDPRRPILGQCVEDEPERVWREKRAGVLPRWFGNLLPEERTPLRRLLAEAHGVSQDDEFALIAHLGEDLPSAVRVRPARGDGGVESGDPDVEEHSDTGEATGLCFSLAGVQFKLSVIERAGKLPLPLSGEGGDHILKISTSFPGLAENEAAMLAWARAAGFEVAEARLVPVPDLPVLPPEVREAGGNALLVRRFDRVADRRVHQEDLAQVTRRPAHQKYEYVTYATMAQLTRGVLGPDGAMEFLRRLALMLAQGNADAHLKNWSLRYEDPLSASWSPLYDLVATVAWPQFDASPALKLPGVAHFAQVDERVFGRLARNAGIAEDEALQEVHTVLERLRDAWSDLDERGALPPEHERRIVEHWARVPLLPRIGPLPR